MSEELQGLKFLKRYEIKDMPCDMERPFAFISYSHDEHDSQIVMNVFKKLNAKGYNLWIDIANIPHDANSWEDAADEALVAKECKLALYFRSESSMKKDTIAAELKDIEDYDHLGRGKIITVDIWKDSTLSAETCRKNILNDGSQDERKICKKICKIVSTNNSAIRLSSDAENDIDKLASEIEVELKGNEVEPWPDDSSTGVKSLNGEINSEKPADTGAASVGKTDNSNAKKQKSALADNADKKSKKTSSITGDITYTLYGKEYTHNQSDMMLTFFAQVLQRHPDKVSKLPEYKGMNCVSFTDYTKQENRNESMPSYFRASVYFTFDNGTEICVGTAYSIQDKLKKMALLLDICEESEDVFESEQVQLPEGTSGGGKGNSSTVTYCIYGTEYTSNQSEMLENACYEILRRHTDCLKMAEEELSCIVLSDLSDVSKDKRPVYFRVMKCYDIDGVSVSVGTAYSMRDKLKLITRLLKLCQEPDDVFRADSYDMPETTGTKRKSRKDAASYMS